MGIVIEGVEVDCVDEEAAAAAAAAAKTAKPSAWAGGPPKLLYIACDPGVRVLPAADKARAQCRIDCAAGGTDRGGCQSAAVAGSGSAWLTRS